MDLLFTVLRNVSDLSLRLRASALLTACAALTSVYAQEFSVRALSEGERSAREPAISETDLAVWVSYDENDGSEVSGELLVYDGQTTRTIARNDVQRMGSTRPVVQSNLVMWVGTFIGSAEEEMRKRQAQGASSTPSNNIAGRRSGVLRWDRDLPTEPVMAEVEDSCALNGWEDLMAWQWERPYPLGWEITAWKAGASFQLTTNTFYDLGPKVSGNLIVWYGWDGHDFEIYLYDQTQNSISTLTTNQYDDLSPVIWDNEIAWEGYFAAESDIYHWKNGETKKLSDNIEDDINPRIWNGQIVWQGFDGDDFEIYFYDGKESGGLPFKVTNNRYDDVNPEIGPKYIGWVGYADNLDSEIFALDKTGGASSGKEIRITTNDEEDRDVRVGSNRLIWQALRNNRSTIFLAEPKTP